MSELRSLYVHVKISQQRLEKFFADKPTTAVVDENWLAWWNSRKMYGPSPLTEIRTFSNTSNRSIADGFLAARDCITDEDLTQEGEWTFAVLMLAENYVEIQPTLAWLHSLAQYMAPEDEGVALIYDYFWGGKDVMAHLELKDQKATLQLTSKTSEIKTSVLKHATDTLKQVFDKSFGKHTD